MERLSKYWILFTYVVYSTVRSRNPPRDTFGGKHCFPGVAGNEYSWPALASNFSVAMERLSKYWILFTYVVYSTVRSRNPLETLLGHTLLSGVAENEYSRTALASNFSVVMERLSKYWILFTYVVYSTVRSRNPPRDTFGRKHCFLGVAENEYSRTALASNFSVVMERLSKYCNPQYPCSTLNSTIPQPPWRHFWAQTLLSGGCGKWVQPTSLGLENLCCNGKIEQILNSLYLCSILNSTIPQPP